MTPFASASPEEQAEIATSVVAAVEILKRTSWNKHKPKRGKDRIPDQPQLPGNAECKQFLQQPEVREAFLNALDRGDGMTLVRFGEMLSKKFVFIEDTKFPLVPVTPFFLVDHWAESKDGLPPFCHLKTSDITQLCIEHLMDESLTEDALARTRSRLKLKPHRRKLDAKVGADGKLTFPQWDK